MLVGPPRSRPTVWPGVPSLTAGPHGRDGSGWTDGRLRGDVISPVGSNLVQIWFVFPTVRIKVPYSQELSPFEGPIAVIDNDDQVEIVLGHHSANAQIGAVTVYGDTDKSWPPGRKVWNQHAYSITNVIGIV